jgi:hypothetical protein
MKKPLWVVATYALISVAALAWPDQAHSQWCFPPAPPLICTVPGDRMCQAEEARNRENYRVAWRAYEACKREQSRREEEERKQEGQRGGGSGGTPTPPAPDPRLKWSKKEWNCALLYGGLWAMAHELSTALEHGADVNAVGPCPAYKGRPDFLDAMLDDTTALMFVAGRGVTVDILSRSPARRAELVTYLLAAGADINVKDRGGKTALMWAASRGFGTCAEALLDGGAEVNAADNEGMTALMWAASNGFPKIVEALLDSGADVNAKNNDGETALDLAEGNKKIVRLLKKAGAGK